MTLLLEILYEIYWTLLVASPFLLLGLLLAGLLHVLMPSDLIQRWLGGPGLAGVTRAALIGVPLPVCSCGVVPIAVEMRRKGASQPASVSFLTTTPESSIDSILLTWGLLGPILAIARPIAAFLTALLGGVLSIAYLDERPLAAGPHPHDHKDGHSHGHGHEHAHDHGTEGDHGHTLGNVAARDALAGLRAAPGRLLASLRRRLSRGGGEVEVAESRPPGIWRSVVRPALRYGFVELLDDLVFWLLLGVAVAGLLSALVPDDLSQYGFGAGLLPMLLVLAASVPLYMCASASTPVAAALLAKGISPGAALVFLLAGPATNAATVLLLGKTFGRRFVQVYLASVILGALFAGLALDAFATRFGVQVVAPLDRATGEGLIGLELPSFVLLSLLIGWRLSRGAWRLGLDELRTGFTGWLPAPEARGLIWRRLRAGLVISLLVLYLASGLRSVPLGSEGYGFLFGRLQWSGLESGLAYVPPFPFGRFEARQVGYARKTDIGFRTDLEMLQQRRILVQMAPRDAWHSAAAAMNPNTEQGTFLTADENLLEMSFSIHYGLKDPAAFFYGLDHRHDLVGLYAEAVAREHIAGRRIEDLLTAREPVEKALTERLQESLDLVGSGLRIDEVHVVDVHPPGGAVFAFRDVSSAREDRETRIHQARELLARDVPRARGEGEQVVAEARSLAESRAREANARAEAFSAEAKAVTTARRPLRHLLWIESAEKTLAGREKIVVPAGSAGRGVTLWREEKNP